MIIYRVENRKGDGPYTRGRGKSKEVDKMLDEHNCSADHPLPDEDNIKGFRSGKHRFGFVSMGDLDRWFDHWLPELKKVGYNVVEIEVDSDQVILGYNQVAFNVNEVKNKKVLN